VIPECAYCGSVDHRDAAAQTAVLQPIRRSSIFFVLASIIGMVGWFIIGLRETGF